MKCHQRVVAEIRMAEDSSDPLFSKPEWVGKSLSDCELRDVPFSDAKRFILQYEWLGTMPSGFRFALGAFWGDWLGGVVVVGSPNPMQIAKSVFGGKMQDRVSQVHRGAGAWWAHGHTASHLLSACAKKATARGDRALVAFSDPMAGEIGTVYQAAGWLYCGMTAKRPDYSLNGKRMVGNFRPTADMVRSERPRKHRYVKLLGSSGHRREAMSLLAWKPSAYPKRESHAAS